MISIAKPIEKYVSLSSSFKRNRMTAKSAILGCRMLGGVSQKVARLWNSVFISLTRRKDNPAPPHSSQPVPLSAYQKLLRADQ